MVKRFQFVLLNKKTYQRTFFIKVFRPASKKIEKVHKYFILGFHPIDYPMEFLSLTPPKFARGFGQQSNWNSFRKQQPSRASNKTLFIFNASFMGLGEETKNVRVSVQLCVSFLLSFIIPLYCHFFLAGVL